MDEYFSIPYGAKTAKDGHWEPGPGMSLFEMVEKKLGKKQLIAEDLGLMTDTVRKLVKDSTFPNMKVIQFGFDINDAAKTNDYLPHNYDRNCVVYTGTHDNETVAGWYKGLKKKEKMLLREYLDDYHTPDEVFYRSINRMAMASVADICILPLQDVLGLDNSARMNQPSTVMTNWRWRMADDMLTKEAQKELRFNWLTKKEK